MAFTWRIHKMMTMEKQGRVKCVTKKHKKTQKKFLKRVENVGSSSYMDNEMETNYYNDEIGSSDPVAFDNEKGAKYDKFRMKQLVKNYKFKVGVEFLSLDEFKEEITE